MSFLLDPFLVFMVGILVSYFTFYFNFTTRITLIISSIVVTLTTVYSILLYLDWVHTDFLVLDTFAIFLPIEQQFGPRIMFHSNVTFVTKDSFPESIVIIFYALYFVWFYLGFKTARQIIMPREPTPTKNLEFKNYFRVIGLFVFLSAGLTLFFLVMIPLDEVRIGDSLGIASNTPYKEALVKAHLLKNNFNINEFSNKLCNPDKLHRELVMDQRLDFDSVSKYENIVKLSDAIPNVSKNELVDMCQAKKDAGENFIYVFVNISTWMFLISIFLITKDMKKRDYFWRYDK